MNIRNRIAAAYTLAHPPKVDLELAQQQPVDPDNLLDRAAIGSSKILFGDNVSVTGASLIKIRAAKSRVLIAGETVLRGVKINVTGQNSAVVIGPFCRIGALSITVTDDDTLVVIGKGTSYEHGALLASSGCSIIIGNDCLISSDVALRTKDGHGIFDATTRELLNPARDVVVGSHVWLGNGVRVGKGAVIGGGTVVGQASVVTGQIKGNSIYAGMPARQLRSNIVWSRTMDPADISEIYAADQAGLAEIPDPTAV